MNDKWAFETLEKQLIEKPIDAIKYNYTLQKELMNHF